MKKQALILLADGFEEIEALTPYDLLNRAGIETVLVSTQNKAVVVGDNNLHVTDLQMMADTDFSKADALIVPGGSGYKLLEANKTVMEEIEAFGKDKVLGAICAGASLPGTLGLYKGIDYTVVPGLNGDFGGHFEKVHAVIAGNIVTGISVGGAFDFALDLITVLVGKDVSEKIAEETCYTL